MLNACLFFWWFLIRNLDCNGTVREREGEKLWFIVHLHCNVQFCWKIAISIKFTKFQKFFNKLIFFSSVEHCQSRIECSNVSSMWSIHNFFSCYYCTSHKYFSRWNVWMNFNVTYNEIEEKQQQQRSCRYRTMTHKLIKENYDMVAECDFGAWKIERNENNGLLCLYDSFFSSVVLQ